GTGGSRRRRDLRQLDQLLELPPVRPRHAALPLLHLLPRHAELLAEDALRHPKLLAQPEHINTWRNRLAKHRSQARGITSLRRAQPFLPPRHTRARHAEPLRQLRARTVQRFARSLDVARIELVDGNAGSHVLPPRGQMVAFR